MTPQEIISDDEIARVHGNANFGAMDPREVVNDGVRKTAVGYHCGSTQLHILRDHGLVTKPRPGSSDADLTKKGKAYARSIYRDTTPARAEAQDEGAAVAWRWRNRPDGVWNYQEDRQRIENVEQQPLYAHPSPPPAAPVEASGSEREDWAELSCEEQMKLATKIAANVGYVLTPEPEHPDSPHNRPQPSGETREAVARIVASEFLRQDYEPDATPADVKFSDGLSWSYVDQGSVDFGEIADRVIAYFDARPLALGGQKGEVECDACKRGEVRHFSTDDGFWVEITTSAGGANEHGLNGWIETLEHYPDGLTKRREYVATDSPALSTTPARAEAQDEGVLSILDCLLDHSGARGSFDAMRHGDAVKDAEELLRSARSPGHTDLMVTPESIDAYMKDNPMEAQDEGAAGEIKSCPFCGGEAEIIHLDDDDNAGGSCVCCTKCQASGNVEFGRKENFVENWNRRAHPSPTPAADDDRVLQDLADRVTAEVKRGADGSVVQALGALSNIEAMVLAALKSTAAKEGGE